MGRARRRSGNTRADWVYRSDKYVLTDPLTQETDGSSGTYYSPMNIGSGESTAQVLYDSANYIGGRFAQGLDAEGTPYRLAVGAEARPDSSRKGPLIHGVELGLYMHVEPSIWTANAVILMGIRIIIARQDQRDGRATLDPGYSMVINPTGMQAQEPSVYANGRENCWEMRYFKNRRTDETGWDHMIHRPFIAFKRRLQAHEGLFVYLELHGNSTGFTSNSFINWWCRTLVTDTNRT